MSARVGVLISGGGTNLQALIDATTDPDFPAQIELVISNRRHAGGRERARRAGIAEQWLWHKKFASREAYDAALVEALRAAGCEWVCLAGFMRIVTPVLLDAFAGRVINIHPALLPAFPGVDGQQQAVEHGVRIAGATVHFVDSGTDTGPIICQGAVPVHPADDVDAVKQRILAVEHRLLPMALRMAVEGRLSIEGRRVHADLRPGESLSIWGG